MAPYRGTRLLSRWGFDRGRRVDTRLVAELIADPRVLARTTPGEWWLRGVSVVIVLASVGSAVLAALVGVRGDLPVGVRAVAVLLLVALAAALFPRPLRVPKGTHIPEGQGVELRRLVDDVATAVGVRSPDAIVIDMTLNAAVARFGWRQRTVLVIGAPLWVILTPEARLSVLAHEFGHLANKDPMRGVLTLPARSFGAGAVAATGGRNPWARALVGADSATWYGGTFGGIAGIVFHGTLALVNTLGATIQLLVDSIAMRDRRRAELYADLIARQVGGTHAFVVSSERLLIGHRIRQDLWDQAPRTQAADLRWLAEESAARLQPWVRRWRQASRRRTDLWSTHPSDTDRMTLVESLPTVEASLVVPAQRWAAVDAEMSAWYEHFHRTLLGTRDRFVATARPATPGAAASDVLKSGS